MVIERTYYKWKLLLHFNIDIKFFYGHIIIFKFIIIKI